MKASRIFVAGAALFITLICWSLVFTVNSHRDEKYHMATIWCSANDNSLCKSLGFDQGSSEIFLITSDYCTPENIEETYKRILVSRELGICRFETKPNDTYSSSQINQLSNFFYETKEQIASPIIESRRNSPYYETLGNFASKNIEKSILSMRIFNGLLFSLLFICMMLILSKRSQTSFTLCSLLVLVPYCFPIIVSINTSSWTAISGIFFWVFLLDTFLTPKKQFFRLGFKIGLSIFSALLMIFGRSETAIFVIGIIVILFFTILKKPPAKFGRKALIVICLLMSLNYVLFLLAKKIPVIGSLLAFRPIAILPRTQDLIGGFSSPWNFFLHLGLSLKRFVLLSPRLLGLENPHWQPPGTPTVAFFATFCLFLAVLLLILRERNSRVTSFIWSFSLFLFFLIFFYTISFTNLSSEPYFFYFRTNISGDSLHSRYLIPLFVFGTGITLFLSIGEKSELVKTKFLSSLVSIAIFTNYSCLFASGKIFRENSSWFWKEIPIGLNTITLIGVLSFSTFALMMGNHLLFLNHANLTPADQDTR